MNRAAYFTTGTGKSISNVRPTLPTIEIWFIVVEQYKTSASDVTR